jgi:hypothetical protein
MMLESLIEGVRNGVEKCSQYWEHRDEWHNQITEITASAREDLLGNFARFEQVRSHLNNYESICVSCAVEMGHSDDGGHGVSDQSDCAVAHWLDGETGDVARGDSTQEILEEPLISSENRKTTCEDDRFVPWYQRCGPARPNSKLVKKFGPIIKEGRNRYISRFKHIERKGSLPFPRLSPLLLPFKADFDDYLSGPTIQEVNDVGRHRPELDNFPTHDRRHMDPLSIHEHWVDYGFRILPSFHQMLYLHDPQGHRAHFMPVPSEAVPKPNVRGVARADSFLMLQPWCAQIGNFEPLDLTRVRGEERKAIVNDFYKVSLSEMLRMAPDPRTEHGIRTFVKGCRLEEAGGTTKEKWIGLDLEADAVPRSKFRIHTAYDVDSFIYVSQDPHDVFNQGLQLHCVPQHRDDSPIAKHNHVCVNILLPPTERRLGARTEWLDKQVGLSSIPHMQFASYFLGSGAINVYIFFPRCMHKHPQTLRQEKIIPPEVQTHFLEKVLFKALCFCSPIGSREYQWSTVKDYKRKGGDKTYSLGRGMLGPLIARMREIISKGCHTPSKLLSRYGSFFFVLDVRGIKTATMEDPERKTERFGQMHRVKTAWENLVEQYSMLDWNVMLDRTRGELYVDVGVSYHAEAQRPMVGLWRLPHLTESYLYGGMSIPDSCRGLKLNLLDNYGSVQAEMPGKRKDTTHIVFRSSYQLLYEIFRTNRNELRAVCFESDAYNANPKFLKDCGGLVEAYERAMGKSFGVRDEWRMSGVAARDILNGEEYDEKDGYTRRIIEMKVCSSLSSALARRCSFNKGTSVPRLGSNSMDPNRVDLWPPGIPHTSAGRRSAACGCLQVQSPSNADGPHRFPDPVSRIMVDLANIAH